MSIYESEFIGAGKIQTKAWSCQELNYLKKEPISMKNQIHLLCLGYQPR